MMPGITTEWVAVTKEMAHEWLGENTHNRNVRPKNVAAFARDMIAGAWRPTGEPIKFNSAGVLLDGQHRLLALIEANSIGGEEIAIEFLVLRGNLEQEAMDAGASRNMGDLLKLRGETQYKVLSTILRSVCVYDFQENWFTHRTPTRAEMFALLEDNPWVRDGCSLVQQATARAHLPSTAGAELFWMFNQIDTEDCEAFFRELLTGEGHAGEPIFMLHRWLNSDDTRARVHSQRVVVAMGIKAWNAWRAGEPINGLRFRAGGAAPEAFPTPR